MILVLAKHPNGEAVLVDGLTEIALKDPIIVPPLRDRIEDIPLLAKDMASEFDRGTSGIPISIVRTLIRHNWPGNLDELKLAVEWLVKDRKMGASEADLIAYLGGGNPLAGRAAISQRDRIVQALLLNNLNRTKTAEHLGITRKTLYNQIKKYNILS